MMWPEWSAWTWWAIALGLTSLYAVPWLYRNRGQRTSLQLAWIVLAIGVPAGAVVMVVALIVDRPAMAWWHPTLSIEQQVRARAECETQAFDAIGGKVGRAGARYEYRWACLVSKGFERRTVDAR